MKHYRGSNSPIKSKFGCVIFDARELQGWQTTGSTASVSLTRSEMNICIWTISWDLHLDIYGIYTVHAYNVNRSQNCLRKFIYLFIRMFMCELRFYTHMPLSFMAYTYIFSKSNKSNRFFSFASFCIYSTLLVLYSSYLPINSRPANFHVPFFVTRIDEGQTFRCITWPE